MNLLPPLPVSRDAARRPAGEGARVGWRALVGAAWLPAVISYLVAVASFAILTAAASADTSVAAAARAGAMGWLAAHHVPLTIDGASLGVLPLLLTLLVGALVARGAAGMATRSGIDQPADAGRVAATIAGMHGVLGASLALAATPATVTADPALAAVACALVAGTAAVAGLARPCQLLSAALRHGPGWVRPGVDAGLWGLGVLLAAGLGTVLTALVVSALDVVQMSGSNAGSVLGLTVLSIGYLPNAAVAGLSWLAGPGFSIGTLEVSPLSMHAGPVPEVPLLAALPQGPVQAWWSVSLVVPMLVGAAVGRRCAVATSELPQRLRILAVAATVMALGSAILGALAGGRLGAAAFDPVDVPFGMLMLAVLAATLLGGGASVLLPLRGMEPDTGRVDMTSEAADGTHDAPEIDQNNGKPADAEPDSSSAETNPNSSAV